MYTNQIVIHSIPGHTKPVKDHLSYSELVSLLCEGIETRLKKLEAQGEITITAEPVVSDML